MDGLVLPDSVPLAGYMHLGGTPSANLSPTLEACQNLQSCNLMASSMI